jgi:hypothetical protein
VNSVTSRFLKDRIRRISPKFDEFRRFSEPWSHSGAGLCTEGGSGPSPGEVGSPLRATVAGPGFVEVEREKEDSVADPGRFAQTEPGCAEIKDIVDGPDCTADVEKNP